MNPRVRMRHLRYFVEAARSGSLVKAADQLSVSQPAVTKSLNELETILGVKLFDRGRKGVELTTFGKAYIEYAAAAIASVSAGSNHIRDLLNAERGHIEVGALALGYSEIVPAAIAQLKRKKPLVTITIRQAINAVLLPQLKLGEIDLVIGRRGEPRDMAGLAHEKLFQPNLMFAVSKDHPLAASNSRFDLADLIDQPWALPFANTSVRRQIDELFLDNGLSLPENLLEGGSKEFLCDFAGHYDAIVALPSNLLRDYLNRGDLIELQIDVDRTIAPVGITRREGQPLSGPASDLVAELRRATARLGLNIE